MNAAAETLSERARLLAPHLRVTPPAGAGLFPVVVMLHGCGGRRPFLDAWARTIADSGAVAVIVDSFAPRGIGRLGALSMVCSGAQLRGRERAGDLYAALAWARAQSWADPTRIVAAGWSHGGWTILDGLALASGEEMARATGLSDLPNEPLAGVTRIFLSYPYAGIASLTGRRDWRIAPKTLAILSGRDRIVGVDAPRRALERQIARGAPIELVPFEGATHAFDDEGAIHPFVRYDPEATARAHALLRDFIAEIR